MAADPATVGQGSESDPATPWCCAKCGYTPKECSCSPITTATKWQTLAPATLFMLTALALSPSSQAADAPRCSLFITGHPVGEHGDKGGPPEGERGRARKRAPMNYQVGDVIEVGPGYDALWLWDIGKTPNAQDHITAPSDLTLSAHPGERLTLPAATADQTKQCNADSIEAAANRVVGWDRRGQNNAYLDETAVDRVQRMVAALLAIRDGNATDPQIAAREALQ